jgi:hypothetical protein
MLIDAIPTNRDTRPPPSRRTLDDLMAFTYPELLAMYRAAVAPASLRAADGVLIGRMLAWNRLARGPIARGLRRFAVSPSFVWEGKTFAAAADGAGAGYNRVHLRGVLGHQHVFPFASRFGDSLLDGRRTIVIDYDRADNPWWMRRIHDELRELEPGLFLGLDLWRGKARSIGLVWFALDARSAR